MLIEAVGRDWNPLIHIPARFFKMLAIQDDLDFIKGRLPTRTDAQALPGLRGPHNRIDVAIVWPKLLSREEIA